MMEYDGGDGNPSDLFLSGQTADPSSGHRRHLFDPYTTTETTNEFLLHHNGYSRTHLQQFSSLYDDDPSNFYMDPSPAILSLNNSSRSSVGFMVVPNSRESGGVMDLAATLGLELGRRTNVSASEDDPGMNGLLYRRSGFRVNAPKCQAERCNADLRNAKHYHRRHKVCEFHSKAATVVAAGLSQRFCQQCSRFHLLSEFDGGKRSCRERLADHNRRRRKIHREAIESKHESKNGDNSSAHFMTTKADSEVQSPSSVVTMGISPPRMLLDSCFARQMAPSPSTNALFLSTGLFGWPHDQS